MKKKSSRVMMLWFIVASMLSVPAAWPEESINIDPRTYVPSEGEFIKEKSILDDPRSAIATYPLKKVVPQVLHKFLFFDPTASGDLWAQVVGFRSPEVVGKIAPDIKPGKYTYQDVQNNPGFKELMTPYLYGMIKQGGPPFAGMIEQFEVIPTVQMFFPLPVAKATLENKGSAKLDAQGYLIIDTLKPGLPFPNPTGEFLAEKYMYNYQERYQSWGWNYFCITTIAGFDKNLNQDRVVGNIGRSMRLTNRIFFAPYGSYDNVAQKRQETVLLSSTLFKPRDMNGLVTQFQYYRDLDKMDALSMWVPALRRIRKVSGTDSQDLLFGLDIIMDDTYFFAQKLSPTVYPYKARVVDEREYLMVATHDGTEYIDTKSKKIWKNIKMMRRPIVVIELDQQDTNYIYGKRILFVDKETGLILEILNYNQRDELYRSTVASWSFDPNDAMPGRSLLYVARDEIDNHVTVGTQLSFPAAYERKTLGLYDMVRSGK